MVLNTSKANLTFARTSVAWVMLLRLLFVLLAMVDAEETNVMPDLKVVSA